MRTPVLYGYERSSTTARVRITLALKGVAVTFRAVDLAADEQRGEAFRRDLNPLAQVPVLQSSVVGSPFDLGF